MPFGVSNVYPLLNLTIGRRRWPAATPGPKRSSASPRWRSRLPPALGSPLDHTPTSGVLMSRTKQQTRSLHRPKIGPVRRAVWLVWPESVPKSMDAQQLAAELVEQARSEGVELVGPGGLLTG